MNPDEEPRTLLTRGFWIALAFALACVLAAVSVVLFAEKPRAHPGAYGGSGSAVRNHLIKTSLG